jgi:hypothetical protein
LFSQTVHENQWPIPAPVGIEGTYPQNIDHFLEHQATQSVQAICQNNSRQIRCSDRKPTYNNGLPSIVRAFYGSIPRKSLWTEFSTTETVDSWR